jgi:diphthamide biosynthesis protein 2
MSSQIGDPEDEGWLVVFGSFCASVSAFGLINSAAVLESYFATHQLAHHTPSEIGWIFSLYLFIVFFVGIQIGPIFDAHGGRILVPAGSLLVALNFNRRRGLATGIATASGGVGGIIFPLILQPVLPNRGSPWSCLILVFVVLGLALPANLFLRTRIPPSHEATRSVWPDFTIFRDLRFAFASAGIVFMELSLLVRLT